MFIIKFPHNSSLFIRNWLTLTNPNSVQLMNFDSIQTFPNQIYIFRYVLWPPRIDRHYPPPAGTSLWICKKCRLRSNCPQQRPLCVTNVEDIPHHYPPPHFSQWQQKEGGQWTIYGGNHRQEVVNMWAQSPAASPSSRRHNNNLT